MNSLTQISALADRFKTVDSSLGEVVTQAHTDLFKFLFKDNKSFKAQVDPFLKDLPLNSSSNISPASGNVSNQDPDFSSLNLSDGRTGKLRQLLLSFLVSSAKSDCLSANSKMVVLLYLSMMSEAKALLEQLGVPMLSSTKALVYHPPKLEGGSKPGLQIDLLPALKMSPDGMLQSLDYLASRHENLLQLTAEKLNILISAIDHTEVFGCIMGIREIVTNYRVLMRTKAQEFLRDDDSRNELSPHKLAHRFQENSPVKEEEYNEELSLDSQDSNRKAKPKGGRFDKSNIPDSCSSGRDLGKGLDDDFESNDLSLLQEEETPVSFNESAGQKQESESDSDDLLDIDAIVGLVDKLQKAVNNNKDTLSPLVSVLRNEVPQVWRLIQETIVTAHGLLETQAREIQHEINLFEEGRLAAETESLCSAHFGDALKFEKPRVTQYTSEAAAEQGERLRMISLLDLRKVQALYSFLKLESLHPEGNSEAYQKPSEILLRFVLTKFVQTLEEQFRKPVSEQSPNWHLICDFQVEGLIVCQDLKKASAINQMFKTKCLVDVAAITLKWVPSKSDVRQLAGSLDLLHQAVCSHYRERMRDLQRMGENPEAFKRNAGSHSPLFSMEEVVEQELSSILAKVELSELQVKLVDEMEVTNYCKIFSVWELFCQLLVQNSAELQKENVDSKVILQTHFQHTQNQRPEFVYNLLLVYLREGKTVKVRQLVEQFLQEDFDAQIYRQFKLPSILIMKIKLFCGEDNKLARAIECADFLAEIAQVKDSLAVLEGELTQQTRYEPTLAKGDLQKRVSNEEVIKQLCLDPGRRAQFFFEAGLAYSQYADACLLYPKRKLTKRKALALFDSSLDIKADTQTLAYLALTLIELRQFEKAKAALRECMTSPYFHGEQDELAVVLWTMMMAEEGQFKAVERVFKYSMKNFIGFSPLSQLCKVYVEYKGYVSELREKESNPMLSAEGFQPEPQDSAQVNFAVLQSRSKETFFKPNLFKEVNTNKLLALLTRDPMDDDHSRQEDLDISQVRHQDISMSSIMNQMRDIDKIDTGDKEPPFVQSFNKATQGMLVAGGSSSSSHVEEGPKKALLLPNGKYCKSGLVLDYIRLVLLTAEMQLHAILMEAKVISDESSRKQDTHMKLVSLSKWLTINMFRGIEKVEGATLKFLQALIDQAIQENGFEKPAPSSRQTPIKAFKQLSQMPDINEHIRVRASLEYCKCLLDDRLTFLLDGSHSKKASKVMKVYSICSHVLRVDYKNPQAWSILGRLYAFVRAHETSSVPLDKKMADQVLSGEQSQKASEKKTDQLTEVFQGILHSPQDLVALIKQSAEGSTHELVSDLGEVKQAKIAEKATSSHTFRLEELSLFCQAKAAKYTVGQDLASHYLTQGVLAAVDKTNA